MTVRMADATVGRWPLIGKERMGSIGRPGLLARWFLQRLPLGDDHPPRDTNVVEIRSHFDDAGTVGTLRAYHPHDRTPHRQGLAAAQPENALEYCADRRLGAGFLLIPEPPLREIQHVECAALQNQTGTYRGWVVKPGMAAGAPRS